MLGEQQVAVGCTVQLEADLSEVGEERRGERWIGGSDRPKRWISWRWVEDALGLSCLGPVASMKLKKEG